MNFIPLISVALIVVDVAIAVIVLLSNPKKFQNIIFSILVLGIASWGLMIWLIGTYPSRIFGQLTFGSITIAATALLLFALSFPKRKIDKIIFFITLAPSLFFLGASFINGSMFVGITVKNSSIQTDIGFLYKYFVVFVLVYTASAFATFFIRYKKSSSTERNQLSLIFGGFGLFVVGASFTNLILPLFGIYQFNTLGPALSIFMVVSTAYAILKARLFDIKLILTELATVLVLCSVAIQIFNSPSKTSLLTNIFIFITISYGGYLIIKSVKHEIEQRQKIQKLARDLEEANDHLEEMDKLKDDFLSMASHELNTPIAAIEGYLSMILDEGLGGEIPPKAREYLKSVYGSSRRLAALVKDLLNVSRIESGRVHLIYAEAQIEDLINQSIMEVNSKAREAKHDLIFEKPASPLPKTWIDTTRIIETIINMLGNAIKYTPDGGKIVVRAVNDDKKIVVSVQDNGKGIPKDKFDRVFAKFTQVDVLKDEVKGTGLGMYISKKFIELHNGKIWFTSDGEGKGSTFFFSVPVLATKPIDAHEGEGPVLH